MYRKVVVNMKEVVGVPVLIVKTHHQRRYRLSTAMGNTAIKIFTE
jgi:hypothetical protein